eukprot:364999-Chlamydomonas_euryale.AAC.8
MSECVEARHALCKRERMDGQIGRGCPPLLISHDPRPSAPHAAAMACGRRLRCSHLRPRGAAAPRNLFVALHPKRGGVICDGHSRAAFCTQHQSIHGMHAHILNATIHLLPL